MKGLNWCVGLVCAGIPAALLGLWLDWDWLALAGIGAIVTVWFGWPLFLLRDFGNLGKD